MNDLLKLIRTEDAAIAAIGAIRDGADPQAVANALEDFILREVKADFESLVPNHQAEGQ